MKKINKALSVLLCLVMALSCFGFAVFAEEPADHEHVYVETVVAPTCADQGYTLHMCTVEGCSDQYKDSYVPALGHSYGEWVEVTAATCTSEGLQERECVRCHGKETKTISVLTHVDENEDGKCDNCGAAMEVKKIFSPFEWLKSFIAFIRDLIHSIFA